MKHLDEVPVVMNRFFLDLRIHPIEFVSIEPIVDEDSAGTFWTLAGILLRSRTLVALIDKWDISLKVFTCAS